VFFPIVTAILTFILTSIFTLYREKKNLNISRRVFFEYAEYELRYPFTDVNLHGEGILLQGKNGKRIIDKALSDPEGYVFTFLVLKNITENDIVNILINFEFSSNKMIKETFVLPIWKSNDTLYIPATVHGSSSPFSTSEHLEIKYCSTSFEKFKFSYKRQKNGEYDEVLSKKYLGFLWIKKMKYHKSGFYSFRRVVDNKKENEVNNS
jgi:hypothetical protein